MVAKAYSNFQMAKSFTQSVSDWSAPGRKPTDIRNKARSSIHRRNSYYTAAIVLQFGLAIIGKRK